MKSVTITTNVANSNPVHGEVYLIQYCVNKFVSSFRQVGGLLVLRFPPPIKLTATMLKVAFNTLTLTTGRCFSTVHSSVVYRLWRSLFDTHICDKSSFVTYNRLMVIYGYSKYIGAKTSSLMFWIRLSPWVKFIRYTFKW